MYYVVAAVCILFLVKLKWSKNKVFMIIVLVVKQATVERDWEHVYFRILIGKQSVKVGVTRIIIE